MHPNERYNLTVETHNDCGKSVDSCMIDTNMIGKGDKNSIRFKKLDFCNTLLIYGEMVLRIGFLNFKSFGSISVSGVAHCEIANCTLIHYC